MTLYGLRGATHGGARVLTLMSPQGAQAVCRHVAPDPELLVYAGPGRLTSYHEKRAGALERLVRRYAVQVLDKPAWDARKHELGEAIYR